MQKSTTRDYVEAVTDIKGRSFDVAFVVMPYHKLKAALPQIYALNTKLLTLVGNDLSPAEIEEDISKNTSGILPIGYLSYICSGNLRKSTSIQRKMMFDASHEAYECVKKKGITVYPKGDDKFYGKGLRSKLMQFLYFTMAKTKIGDVVACERCRNSVSEMEEIDLFYENLLKDCPES